MDQAWVLPIFSFISFLLVAFLGRFLPGRGSLISIAAIAAGFIGFWVIAWQYVGASTLSDGCALQFGQKTCQFSIEWFTVGDAVLRWGIIIDPLSIILIGMITLVGLLVQVYSLGYMKGDSRFGWYFALHSLFIASMLTLVLADNFLLLYLVWELVGICSYLLIGFWYEKRAAAEAAKKAFIVTRIGDVGLLIGILILFSELGTFDMSETFVAISNGQLSDGTLFTVAILLFLGAMGKSAQFPFHVWLPDAMEGPTPVSALIHAATMVAAGVYLVARAFPIFEASPNSLIVVASIGLITSIIGASMALVMTDLKKVLAYSTISHLGLMMVSLGSFGLTAAILHLLAHGFSKALLFLGAGSIMHSTNNETDIRNLGGIRRVMPVTALTFTIGALSLAGVPLLAGFWSKDEILLTVLHHKNYMMPFVFIVVFLSALYITRLLFIVFFGDLKKTNANIHESPKVMLLPLGILAFFATFIGLISIKLTNDGGLGTFLFRHKPHDFEYSIVLIVASVVVTLGAVAISWQIFGRNNAVLQTISLKMGWAVKIINNKYYIDHVYEWCIARVVMTLSTAIALFDRVVINDTAVDGTAESVKRSGLNLRYHISGKMYNYALGMAIGLIFLTIFFWLRMSRT